jgi:hypothetical protein
MTIIYKGMQVECQGKYGICFVASLPAIAGPKAVAVPSRLSVLLLMSFLRTALFADIPDKLPEKPPQHPDLGN